MRLATSFTVFEFLITCLRYSHLAPPSSQNTAPLPLQLASCGSHEAGGVEAEGLAVADDKSPCTHKFYEGLWNKLELKRIRHNLGVW